MKKNLEQTLLKTKEMFLEIMNGEKLKIATSKNKKLKIVYEKYINVIECFEDALNKFFNNGLNIQETNIEYILMIFKEISQEENNQNKNYLEEKIIILKEQFSIFLHEIYKQKILNESNVPKNKQCFAPYDLLIECTNEADGNNIRLAHTISDGNNFKTINRAFPENKFSSFNTNPRDRDIHFISDLVDNKRKNANSTEYVFCHHHDPILFADIETTNNIDINNEKHHLLQNYRIFYKRQSEEIAIIECGVQKKYESEIAKIWGSKPYSSLFSKEAIREYLRTEKLRREYKDEKIRSYAKDTLADACFRCNQKHKTIYLVFELDGYTKVLSSTCGMAKYLNDKIPNDTEVLFFHVLQNKDKPCIIFSGFESDHIIETLSMIENLYYNSKHEFIEFVASYLCISDNSFFTTAFVNNLVLKKKFEDYYNNDNKLMSKYKDSVAIFSYRNFIKNRISLTPEEASFLFTINHPKKNF